MQRLDDALPWVAQLDDTQTHALEGACIRQELAAAGQRIQQPEMLLAGIARSRGVPVVTADSGSTRVEEFAVENHRERY